LLETHTAVTRNRLIAPSGNLHQNTLFLGLKDFPLRCENPALKDHLNELHEELAVVEADAIVDPWAVVVHV
jgi:hypothetical protein